MDGHNYCRNPDGVESIWCYTTDPKKRWELCKPIDGGDVGTRGPNNGSKNLATYKINKGKAGQVAGADGRCRDKPAVDSVMVEVESAGYTFGNKCTIKVNGKVVNVKKSPRGTDRGMHMVVIQPNSGNIISAQSYDTHGSYAETRKLA